MAHLRNRYLSNIINKKLRFSPIVTIQGARQTGKSVLARELLPKQYKLLQYVSLDKAVDREFANSKPDSFIAQFSDAKPLVIDEAQKAPALFDAIKLAVDTRRIPGKYLLLGSTEFSKQYMIRETLTGRVSRARLYPFTVAESLHQKLAPSNSAFFLKQTPSVSREDLLRYLRRGGLPGIFAVHDNSERQSLLSDWIDLTVQRDLQLFSKIKANSDIALKILQGVALLDHPDLSSLAKFCKRDSRIIERHIEMLKTLFVLEPLNPHPWGTGKAIFFLCDVALAAVLGASFERLLYTWGLLELRAKSTYLDQTQRQLFYYRNSKGACIHFIEERNGSSSALKIISDESVNIKDFYLLIALKKKRPDITLFGLASSRFSLREEHIEIYPWECII